jgi:hypothetical protein
MTRLVIRPTRFALETPRLATRSRLLPGGVLSRNKVFATAMHASPAKAGVHFPAARAMGDAGPGFPHGSSSWAEGPRDSGPFAVSCLTARRSRWGTRKMFKG